MSQVEQGTSSGRGGTRAGRSVADFLAKAAMGSWVVLAVMPVVVVVVALS